MSRIIAIALPILFLAFPALGQSINIDMGESGGSTTARIVQMLAVITILSIAPALMMMVTSFTRIVVVLSFLRQAMGTQTSPPNMVMMSLALFLTAFVMMPTFQEAYQQGVLPLTENRIDEMQALERAAKPFHVFMMKHARDQDLRLFMELSKTPPVEKAEDVPYQVLIPSFMISELRRAFEMGFLLFLPFLVIDMVISSVLMSMGMMMLPPVMISMPFKLIFFVLVDGWYLIAGSLVKSF
jgi:flagellar biosynthetic protein FliP